MGIVVYHWWEYKLSHYGKQWFLKKKKKKNRNIILPRNSTSECIPKGYETSILKIYLYPHVDYSITHSSQDMEAGLVPIYGWWTKKIHTCRNIIKP